MPVVTTRMPRPTLIATCNPWANRQAGDFMILWDQQGGSKDLYLLTWSGTAPNLVLSPPQLLNANVSDAEYSADGFFGEGALNLTDTVFGGSSLPVVRQRHPQHRHRQLEHGRLQGHDPCACRTPSVTARDHGDHAQDRQLVRDIPAGGLSITTAGVVEVKDSAVIDIAGGTAVPAGTINFSLCMAERGPPPVTSGPRSWIDQGRDRNAPTRSRWSHRAPGSPRPVGTAGRPRSLATLPAASGIERLASDRRVLRVNPVTPDMTTTAGPDVTLGSAVTDTAALTGTAPQPTTAVIQTSAPSAGTRTGGRHDHVHPSVRPRELWVSGRHPVGHRQR